MGAVRKASTLAVLSAAALMAGCGAILKQGQEALEGEPREFSHSIPTYECKSGTADGRAEALRSAISGLISGIPSSALTATERSVGSDTVERQALGVISGVWGSSGSQIREVSRGYLTAAFGGGSRGARNEPPLEVSSSGLQEELRKIQDVASRGGFSRLAAKLDAAVAGGGDEGTRRVRDTAKYFARYFEAYFRKGRFLTVAASEGDALKRLKQDLRNGYNADGRVLTDSEEKAIADAARQLLGLVCAKKPCTFLEASNEGYFFNRAGQKFGFPTISLTLKPGGDKPYELTRIDEVQVVGDLTRVFFEALFDSLSGTVPSDENATGCRKTDTEEPLFAKGACIPAGDEAGRKVVGEINWIADMAEGTSGYVAAQAVRGGWFLSLGNEAVAQLLQTAISVSARKTAELSAWYALQCDGGGTGGHSGPAKAGAGRSFATVPIRFVR